MLPACGRVPVFLHTGQHSELSIFNILSISLLTPGSLFWFMFLWFLVRLQLTIFSYVSQLSVFLLGIVSFYFLAFFGERLFIFFYLQFLGMLYKFFVLCVLNLCCKYFLSAFSVSFNFATGIFYIPKLFIFMRLNHLISSVTAFVFKFFPCICFMFLLPKIKTNTL